MKIKKTYETENMFVVFIINEEKRTVKCRLTIDGIEKKFKNPIDWENWMMLHYIIVDTMAGALEKFGFDEELFDLLTEQFADKYFGPEQDEIKVGLEAWKAPFTMEDIKGILDKVLEMNGIKNKVIFKEVTKDPYDMSPKEYQEFVDESVFKWDVDLDEAFIPGKKYEYAGSVLTFKKKCCHGHYIFSVKPDEATGVSIILKFKEDILKKEFPKFSKHDEG